MILSNYSKFISLCLTDIIMFFFIYSLKYSTSLENWEEDWEEKEVSDRIVKSKEAAPTKKCINQHGKKNQSTKAEMYVSMSKDKKKIC